MIIGIDPGLTGAIAFVEQERYFVVDLPTMANGKGKAKVKRQIDPGALKEIIGQNVSVYGATRAYLERMASMPGQGVQTMFSLGDTFGAIRSVMAIMKIRTEIITSQSWKKYYKLTSDKELCRAKAIELFPGAELSRKKDHNRAEALLIANYGLIAEKIK